LPAELQSILAFRAHAASGVDFWPELIDAAQDLCEQRSRHRHLGQLEHHVAAVAHDPGADLDQLLAQGGERPMLDSSTSFNVGLGSWLCENTRSKAFERGPAR
jgi:hypothetical protein